MQFIEINLENILQLLSNLSSDSKPLWGNMSAQYMIEHLSDALQIATGKSEQQLESKEEDLSKMIAFLHSDKPLPKGFKVGFAPEAKALRNEELELAIDELVDELLYFEEYYELNPTAKHVHPTFGSLGYTDWKILNEKHFTHHFQQFGLID